MDFHPLDGILAVDEADGLAVVVRLYGAVHDEDVPLVHVGVHHGHAVHAEEKGRCAVTDQEFHEVQLFPDVFGRGRKTSLDFAHEGEFEGIGIGDGMGFHAISGWGSRSISGPGGR